jgi:hypothetical protein
MELKYNINFTGNKKVDAHFRGFTLKSDQSVADGGDNTAPSSFELFLASIGMKYKSEVGPMRFMFRLFTWFIAISLIGTLVGCAAVDVHSKPGTTTTVILLRHAERDGNSDDLNTQGLKRAKALADLVSPIGVTAIYSPDVPRNLNTVQPLANRLGIEITRTPEVSFFLANSIVSEILDKHAGGVVVYVGNVSGNLQRIYRLFGGTGTGPIGYGDLHILTIPDAGPVTVVKKAYGKDVGMK